MEKGDVNTFGGRSEFFGGVYPVMALGVISSMVGWTQSVLLFVSEFSRLD
jgi:hypothetical protein